MLFQSMMSSGADGAYSVGEVTTMIRHALQLRPELGDVRVVGEVTNVVRAQSGHLYFSLKDASAMLACVMWKSNVVRLKRVPVNGDSVLVRGVVTLYERQGRLQLEARSLAAVGEGSDALQFEELKRRLAEEGLFAQERKRMLPVMPRVIGIVTSPTGAALQDVIKVLGRQWPLAELIVSPTQVQGETAPREIVAAIRRVERICDVLIVARGGGSAEDLAPFNDEDVVRAVATATVPVVSGVGHEVDVTLTDLAADVRAATPTAAAGLVVPQITEIRQRIDDVVFALDDLVQQRVDERRADLRRMELALRVLSPQQRLTTARQRVTELSARLERAMQRELERRKGALAMSAAQLKALDPSAVLERGYAIVRGADGVIQRSTASSASGDRLSVQLRDGVFDVRRE